MLSEKSRPVIKTPLPIVGAHIQEIAQCFYRHCLPVQRGKLDTNMLNQMSRSGIGTRLFLDQQSPANLQ